MVRRKGLQTEQENHIKFYLKKTLLLKIEYKIHTHICTHMQIDTCKVQLKFKLHKQCTLSQTGHTEKRGVHRHTHMHTWYATTSDNNYSIISAVQPMHQALSYHKHPIDTSFTHTAKERTACHQTLIIIFPIICI